MSFASFLLIALAFLQQPEPFKRFVYCRELPNGTYEQQCMELKPDGTGQARFKSKGTQDPPIPITLSPAGRDKFLSLIAATRNLADRQKYESKRKVANLGHKHITLELASETREADFNYSDLKEMIALTGFFDGLINQQTIAQGLETAAQYERLSIPDRLDQLEQEMKVGRLGDPPSLAPTLDKIIQNERILDYARQHAQQLKSQLIIAK